MLLNKDRDKPKRSAFKCPTLHILNVGGNLETIAKMKNESKIKGDGNVNIQDVSKSKISIGDKTTTESKLNKLWIILPVIIALIGLIVQVLIGWKQLINWFYVK